LGAAQALGADAPAGKPKPDSTPMPQISLGKYSVSRLIVGCHDIDGGSHMSPFLDKEMHDYYTPERAVQTLRRCEEVGINVTVASGASCVGWYLGRIGFREFHQNGKGYKDGEGTRCGERAILAWGDPAMGGKRAGDPAILRTGRGARAPLILVAAKVAGRPRPDAASAKHQES
jgi:hypothetical protein